MTDAEVARVRKILDGAMSDGVWPADRVGLDEGFCREVEIRLGIKIEELQRHVGNLLARIHRDGGQYQHEHGIEKAVADADKIVADLFSHIDELIQKNRQ